MNGGADGRHFLRRTEIGQQAIIAASAADRLVEADGFDLEQTCATIATNLRAAQYQNVNAENRTFTLLMPEPKPMQIRVNHDSREKGGSYFYAITSEGLEPLIPDTSNRSLAINNSLAFAQKQIERSCNRPQIIAVARKNAEDVLNATFQATGWKAAYVWK